MAAQPWKAFEYVNEGGTWDLAQHSEQAPPEGWCGSLTGSDLSSVVTEAEQASKLNPSKSPEDLLELKRRRFER